MMKKKMRKAAILTIAALLVATVSMGICAEGKKKKEKAVFDPDGTYHAALGIQTCNTLWITNMSYFEGSQNDLFGTENARKLVYRDSGTMEKTVADGEFQDVEITGNGTYTVALTGADFVGETTISQLHIATDIPLNDEVSFQDVTASVNGQTVAAFEEGYMEDEEPYLQGGMVCLVFNHWRIPLVEQLESEGLREEESGYPLLNGTGGEEVSITFTISGFTKDGTGEAAQEETAPSDDDIQNESEDTEFSQGQDNSDDSTQVSKETAQDGADGNLADQGAASGNDADGDRSGKNPPNGAIGWIWLCAVLVPAVISALAGKKNQKEEEHH